MLGLAYLLDHAVGSPSAMLTRLIDLNGEQNLPSWYSSIQLAAVALIFGLVAARDFRTSSRDSWVLTLLPALLLLLSLDEAAGIHEKLGRKSDWLLPHGTRLGTAFHRTGIWMFALGLPLLLVLLLLWRVLAKRLSGAPGVVRKLALGFAIFLGGALGMETLSNVERKGSVLTTLIEETMEMAGVTVLFWAGADLLRACRFSIHLDAAPPRVPTPRPGRAARPGEPRARPTAI